MRLEHELAAGFELSVWCCSNPVKLVLKIAKKVITLFMTIGMACCAGRR